MEQTNYRGAEITLRVFAYLFLIGGIISGIALIAEGASLFGNETLILLGVICLIFAFPIWGVLMTLSNISKYIRIISMKLDYK